jgi:hypothetical protein
MSIAPIASAEQDQWAEVAQYWNHARAVWSDSVGTKFEEGMWTLIVGVQSEFGDALATLARVCSDARTEVP